MRPPARRSLLGIALVLTLVAAVAVSKQPQEPPLAEAVVRVAEPATAASEPRAPSGGNLGLSTLQRPPMEISDANPFAPKSWYVAPPAQAAVPDAKPAAPPLPFVYKGKLGEDDGRQLYYLAKGDESFVIAIGDTFAGTYQLESAREGALVIKYLPLSAAQILRYGPEL